MPDELFQQYFTDTTGGTDEESDKTGRKSGGDAEIRRLDISQGDHGVV